MRNILAITLLVVSTFASATDLNLNVGRDRGFKADVAKLSVGTSVAGFSVAGELSKATNSYQGYGIKAAKNFSFENISVGPIVGVQYINPNVGKSGYVANYGAGASLALSKNVSVDTDLTRNYSLKDGAAFTRGNILVVGLKTTF